MLKFQSHYLEARNPLQLQQPKSFCHSNIIFPALNFYFKHCDFSISKPNYYCVVVKSNVFLTSGCEVLSGIVSDWYMTLERGSRTKISSKGELKPK